MTAGIDLQNSLFDSAPSCLYNGDLNKSYYLGGGKPPLPKTNIEIVRNNFK